MAHGFTQTRLGSGSNLVGKVQIRNPGDTVDLGDNTNPIRIDPTGTTAQPITDNAGSITIDASSLPLPTGASTLAEQQSQTTSLQLVDDIVYVDDTSTHSTGTSKGALFMAAATPTDGSVNANDIGAVAMTTDRKLHVSVQDSLPTGTNNIGDVDVLTVPAPLSTTGGGTEATALRVTVANDSTGVLSVDDNGSSITVDNAGTFAVQATIASGASSIAKAEDSASANLDVGVPSMAVRKASPANTSDTDGDYEMLQMSAGRLWTSSTIDTALPAGTNAIGKLSANSGVDIGDVDVTSVVPGTSATNLGKAVDNVAGSTDTGVAPLVIRDDALTTLTPVDGDYVNQRANARGASWVAIEDGAGGQITSFGGGTEYTEDAAAAADPVGKAAILVRKDTPATITSTDGDNVAQRGTNYGAAYVQVVSSTGSYVDTFGGGTQYTEDVASAADPVGNMGMAVRADSLAAVTSTDGDNIALRATNKGELYVKQSDSVAITAASLPLPSGAATSAAQTDKSQFTKITDGTDTALVTAAGEQNVIATAQPGVDIGDVTINNAAGGSAVNVQDGGNSLTVDNAGTFAVQASIASGASTIGKAEDSASANLDVGVPSMAVRKATPANTSDTDGDYEMLQMSAGRLWTSTTVDAALPSGTNNIGDVDVLTVPADPFGANADAASATGSISAKLRFIASTGIPVTGTVTVGSHAVTNAGTFAVQDSEKITDNAGFTDGTTKVQPAGFIFDEAAGTALTENDAAAARIDSKRAQIGVIEDATTRGQRAAVDAGGALSVKEKKAATPSQSSVSVTSGSTSILASNANRLGATIYNEGSAICYMKLGSTASTTSYTLQIASGGYYEVPFGYTGAIDGITSSGTAQLRVTELT